MSRVIRFLGVVACLSGCLKDESADACLSVNGIHALRADCQLSGRFQDIGYVDVSLASAYQLSAELDVSGEAPCGDTVSLRGLDVELEFPRGFVEAIGDSDTRAEVERNLSLTQLFSGTIVEIGGGGFRFEVLSGSLLDALHASEALADGASATVIVHMTFFGSASGGAVESATFTYPIQMCSGCLKVDLGPCDALPTGTFPEAPCNVGQDSVLECCTYGDGGELCPAAPIASL